MLTHFPQRVKDPTQTYKQVISVGRLENQKGYDLLIEAWKRVAKKHRDWKLAIYGEGSDRAMLEERIGSYGLKRQVTLYPPTNRIYEKYMESDVLRNELALRRVWAGAGGSHVMRRALHFV